MASKLVCLFVILAFEAAIGAHPQHGFDFPDEECSINENGESDCHLGLAQLRKQALVANQTGTMLTGFPEFGKEFVLQHFGGKCVHPAGGADDPADDTKLILYDGCSLERDALVFTARAIPMSQGLFQLEQRRGKCVHPQGGSASPSDDTRLVYHTGCDLGSQALQLKFLPAEPPYFGLQHASGKCVHPVGGNDHPPDNTELVYYDGCNTHRGALIFKALMIEPPTPAPTSVPTSAPTPAPDASANIYGDPHVTDFQQ